LKSCKYNNDQNKLLLQENIKLETQLQERDSTIVELRQQLKEKDETIASLASKAIEQPKTVNNSKNNVYINMRPISELTPEYIQKRVQADFTRQHFIQGQKGVAQFAYEKILTDHEGNLYACVTDPSRHVYRLKGKDGETIRDIQAKKITTMIAEPVTEKAGMIFNEIKDDDPWYADAARKFYQEIQRMGKDNTDLCKELTIMLSD
jgi:hypothetical protein